MKIIFEKINAEDLKPGDLFTLVDPDIYWDLERCDVVGHKVYIRTNNGCVSDNYAPDDPVYLVTIDKETT